MTLTLPHSTKPHKPITHYAIYREVTGTAELVKGTGYLFRAEGERTATLVRYTDPNLMLFGRCDLVAAADAADGDRVLRCSQTLCIDDGQLDLFVERVA